MVNTSQVTLYVEVVLLSNHVNKTPLTQVNDSSEIDLA